MITEYQALLIERGDTLSAFNGSSLWVKTLTRSGKIRTVCKARGHQRERQWPSNADPDTFRKKQFNLLKRMVGKLREV